jgi:hypothetical protein
MRGRYATENRGATDHTFATVTDAGGRRYDKRASRNADTLIDSVTDRCYDKKEVPQPEDLLDSVTPTVCRCRPPFTSRNGYCSHCGGCAECRERLRGYHGPRIRWLDGDPGPPAHCGTCGEDVFGPPWADARRMARESACTVCERRFFADWRTLYCSKNCRGKAQRQRTRRERPALVVGCSVCGESIDAKRRSRRYCSDACRQRAYRQRTVNAINGGKR